MNTSSMMRTAWVALRNVILFTLLIGVVYTGAVTGVGQLIFHDHANGSPLKNAQGQVVGSKILAQNFTDDKYFAPRPSAAGDDGYDATSSGGTNYGPENQDLVDSIKNRKADMAKREHVSEDKVPADAVTASASGLDPDISPEYASIQIDRVAKARGTDRATIEKIVDKHTHNASLGYLGDKAVNVVELNNALDSRGK